MSSGYTPFENDVTARGGLLYTGKRASLSAFWANRHLTTVTYRWLKRLQHVQNVVDFGCGDGEFTAELALLFPKKKFIGIEPSSSAVSTARKNYPSCNWYVGDLMDLASLPSSISVFRHYDAWILRGVLHHVPNPQTALKTIHTFTQAHSQTQNQITGIIIEPNGWNLILKILEKVSPYHRAHQEQSFTSWQIKNWAKTAGFINTKTYYVGLVPFFCPDSLAKIFKKIEPYIENTWVAPFLCAQVIIEVKHLK